MSRRPKRTGLRTATTNGPGERKATRLLPMATVRPIRALTGAAEALKRGDYAGATVTVKSGDEIGQLARTFNVMIDVLRQRERERGTTGRGDGRAA